MAKVSIEVVGNEEDVLSFVSLCAKIHYLSTWGASRTIPVAVDGDGSCDLQFKITGNVEGKGETDLLQSWKETRKDSFYKELDKGHLEIQYIGE